ncbi:MAG: ABC transporter ATP-binding protein [Alphaproteobacteria bacterium]
MTEAPAVQVDALSKAFGGLRAVDGVSLTVAPGERRVLIGPNGAGKTTLFHCIFGTLPASSGRVLLHGHDVTSLPDHQRAALGMARTFQISDVFAELTLAENLTLAIIGTDRRKWSMLRRVPRFPAVREAALEGLRKVGLAARADEPVQRISYGERRQLEFALALCTGAQVILLDEPCAGLSQSERQRISAMVAELPRDITVLMIEHDMDVALALADRVTVLHRGAVLLEGSPAEVRADPQVHEVYFGHA